MLVKFIKKNTFLFLSSNVLGSIFGKSLIATGSNTSMKGTMIKTENGTNRKRSAAVLRNYKTKKIIFKSTLDNFKTRCFIFQIKPKNQYDLTKNILIEQYCLHCYNPL